MALATKNPPMVCAAISGGVPGATRLTSCAKTNTFQVPYASWQAFFSTVSTFGDAFAARLDAPRMLRGVGVESAPAP
jgi:hypothetical protein